MIIIDPVPANQQDTDRVRAYMSCLVLAWPLCFPEGKAQTDRNQPTVDPLTVATFGSQLNVKETDVNEGPVWGTGARWDCWRDIIDEPESNSFQLGLDDSTFTNPLSETCQKIATSLYTEDYVERRVANGETEDGVRKSLQGAEPADYHRPVAVATVGALFNADGTRNVLTF